MKKRIIILLLVIGMLMGCKAVTGERPVSEETEFQKEADKPEQNKRELRFGSIVAEDNEFIYLCSSYRITKINKATGSSEILWQSNQKMTQQKEFLYATGCGLLIGDKLYFLEEWMDESVDNYGMMKKAFSVIHTDGTSYQRLEEIYATDMFLQDGVLCLNIVKDDGYVTAYSVLEDGSLSMKEAVQDNLSKEGIPDEYTAEYYTDNGEHALAPWMSLDKLGYYLMRNENYELVRKYPEDENTELLPHGLSAYSLHTLNDTHILMSNYEDDKRVYYLVDKQTFEKRPLMEFPWGVDIVTMDDTYVYLHCVAENENDSKMYLFEKVELETGEVTVLFGQEPFWGLSVTPSTYLADYVLHNGYIYYVGMQDYKLYMMRRNLDDLTVEERLGDAFFDSRIGEVGTVAYEYAEFFGTVPDKEASGAEETANNSGTDEEEPCATVELEWLVVDEKYPGAASINSYMKEHMNEYIRYEKEMAQEVYEFRREYEGYFPAYSISSNIYEVTYVDDTYLSYCQAYYEYTGGAHGMPYRIGYTFHLQTGELLTLSDVIGNSEKELKEIVGKYFEELIAKEPENYWEGSVENVKEWTDMSTDFYLTEEGIRFYQTPYAISSYATGFPQVTIPYNEFEMKIPIVATAG